jgi:hypothetical protein
METNIKKSLGFFLCLFLSSSISFSQSSDSKVVKFIFDESVDVFMPPELYVDIDFIDDNNNKILEANESGTIQMIIQNRGGNADKVKIDLSLDKDAQWMTFTTPFNNIITSIPSDSEKKIDISFKANKYVPTDSIKMRMKISEPLGYDIKAEMVLTTFELQKPLIKLQGVSIIDAGRGLRAMDGNPDGKLQRGEIVNAIVTIQNVGQNIAENVSYSILSRDPNVKIYGEEGVLSEIKGKLNNMEVGEIAEIAVRISPNNNYNGNSKYLPLYITVNESLGEMGLISENIPIPIDQAPEKVKSVKVEPNVEKLMAMKKTQIVSSSDRISSKIKIRDISVAPLGEPLHKNAIAIVLGAEKNGYDIAPAPYAARDAEIMAKYFKNTLGIQDVRVYTNENLTKAKLSDIFDANGELERAVSPGVTDVFVFYSGHGMPDKSSEEGMDVYLLPYDGRKDMLKERCYSINKMYSCLNDLKAKSVTVILDACFSGSSRQSGNYAGVSIGNTKGVSIEIEDLGVRPWETNPNFRLITSSSGEQTSLGFDQSQSGLFTYYLAIGMQGEADANNDGSITYEELFQYIKSNVSSTARQIRNGDQTPQFFGEGSTVLQKMK